jgi:heme-degrading monooxygenase HmoA
MTATITAFRGSTTRPETIERESEAGTPVAILSSFTLSPTGRHSWENLWTSIACAARTWQGCRLFQILSDRNDPMYGVVFSEWDSLDAYTAFTHHAQTNWAMQAVRGVGMPGECRFLNIASEETDRGAILNR